MAHGGESGREESERGACIGRADQPGATVGGTGHEGSGAQQRPGWSRPAPFAQVQARPDSGCEARVPGDDDCEVAHAGESCHSLGQPGAIRRIVVAEDDSG